MVISENLRGMGFMCLSMGAFTVNDAFMKAATVGVPLFQAIALRGVLTILGLGALALWTGALRFELTGTDRRLIALRSLAEVASTALFLLALTHMEIGTLSAIMQALPLAVTFGAFVVFGERVTRGQLLAIGIGFVGVVMILQPGGAGFDRWALMGAASVLGVVVRDLAVRGMRTSLPSALVALAAALAVTALGLTGAAIQGWGPINALQSLQILAAGSCLVVGYIAAVQAMRHGDIGVVAPFRYTSLLWALVLGATAFGTFPDRLTLWGALIVVVAGVYTLAHDRLTKKGKA